ncbi:MAG: YvcK family protein [Candidatus Pacebacteria bacterium]|nr:YvcK family protein [Candidatus Paceibacterota bacterium]
MKNIVIIGGGNGSTVVINALKPFHEQLKLSAVISMCDSGGANGRLRKEFGLPYSDLLRATLAMSPFDFDLLKRIFVQTRFVDCGKLDTHYLGNLFLALSAQYDGNVMHAVRALHQAVEAVGKVYPVTQERADVCVSLTDGSTVTGEHEIDRPTYDRSKKIVRTWLEPMPMINEEAKRVIEEADVIFVGPGSLYTSIIPNLLTEGMTDALRASKAKLYFISGNSYEAGGETGPETIGDVIKTIQEFIPRSLSGVVFNSSHIVAKYKDGVRTLYVDDLVEVKDIQVIKEDLGTEDGLTDAKKLGSVLIKLV